jgi:proline dehydrogenase
MISRALILRTASLKPVEKTVRRSRLFRPLVSRFIAGDTLDDAIPASEALLAKNLRVTLDYLGENTHREDEALAAKQTYIRMLDRIALVPRVSAYSSKTQDPSSFEAEPLNISIKLTQCGLDLDLDLAERIYREVLEAAARSQNFIRIDMESSEFTQRTIDIVLKVLPDHPNTGLVLQSYLYRTDEDVERMIDLKARVRLCKGAYLEPGSVAYPEKHKVDEAYVRQAKRLLEAGTYPALATHDERIVKDLKLFAAENGIDKSRFEFQMLYGIRRDLQESLVREGYNVRIYVPYGDRWYPYFTRRLAERPANSLFILKTLFKG